MAQKNISFGSFPNDPDADAIRTAFQKVQENFNEVYAGVEDQAVSSINRVPGQGITVSAPTGNVIISANLACVQVSSFTLSVSRDIPSQDPNNQSTFLNSSSQTLNINLPTTISNVSNINLSGTLNALAVVSNTLSVNTANISNLFISGNTSIGGNISIVGNAFVGNLNSNTVNATSLLVAGNSNLNNLGLSGLLSVVGNITGGNLITSGIISTTGNGIFGNLQTTTLNATSITSETVSATGNGTFGNIQANSISSNTLSIGNSISVTGNITSGNLIVNGNVSATGNGTFGNLNGGNLVSANYLSGTLTTNAQPNITSVGILSSLSVLGNANIGNIGAGVVTATGNVTADNFLTNGLISVAGNATVGSLITTGVVSANGNLTAGNIATGGSIAATGNLTVGNLSSSGNANIGNLNATGVYVTTLGTTGNATIGNLTVTGSFSAGDINTSSIINGNSNVDISNPGGHVTIGVEGVANVATFTDTGANIIGTFSASGNANFANIGTNGLITSTGNIQGNNLLTTGNLSVGGNANIGSVGATTFFGNLSSTGNSNVGNLSVSNLQATGNVNLNGPNVSLGSVSNLKITGAGANGYFLYSTDNLGNVGWTTATSSPAQGSNTQVIFNDGGAIYAGNSNLTFDKTAGNLTVGGNSQLGNLASANYISGTLTTNAQPNITSIGHLTGLIMNGNINASNISINNTLLVTGNANYSSSPNVTLGSVSNVHIAGGTNGQYLTTNGFGNLSWSTQLVGTELANGTSNVVVSNSGNVTVSVAGNSNVLTATSSGINITGTLSVSGNSNVGNISATAGIFTTVQGSLTTASQSNVTSVGTLTGLNVNGNITAANITANTGVFTGNAAGLINIPAGNISGQTANALVAGTVYTNAQPNITSVGTLASLSVSGNITAGNITANTKIECNLIVANSMLTVSAYGQEGLEIIPGTSGGTSGVVLQNFNRTSGLYGNMYYDAKNHIFRDQVTERFRILSSGAISTGTSGNNTGNVGQVLTSNGAGHPPTWSDAIAITAGTVTTNAQPNITSVGTLSSLNVSGVTLLGGYSQIPNYFSILGVKFTGSGSQYGIALQPGTDGTNMVTFFNAANVVVGSITQTASNVTFNGLVTGSNVVGTVPSATTSGTVTTNAQPNITSVGTLSSLSVSGNITAGNLIGIFANGNSNISIPAANGNITFATAGSERMRINADGSIGIGTTSPTNKFQVSGDGVRSVSQAATNTGNAELEAQVYNYWSGTGGPTYTGTAIAQYGAGATGTTAGISNANLGTLRFQNGSGALIYTNGGSPLIFGTTGTERMRIDSSGSVGIGTSSPSSKLDINTGADNNIALKLRGSSGLLRVYGYYNFGGNDYGPLLQATNLAENAYTKMGITATNLFLDANVGIGTSNPLTKLVVSNSGAQGFEFDPLSGIMQVYNRSTSAYGSMLQYGSVLRWFTGASPVERMRLDSSGNLGIGTNSPTTTVDIAGSLKTTAGVSDTTGTGAALRMANPGAASYATASDIVNGAIKIRLPAAANNSSSMLSFTLHIYEYNGGNSGTSRTMRIGGYNYSLGSWYNVFATQETMGGGDINVRFGFDGTSDCIWVGDIGGSWAYPQVFISDIQIGYSNMSPAMWDNDWSISFATSYDTVEIGPIVAGKNLVSVNNALTITNITTGANVTPGSITGNWTLTAGSRLQATYADLAEYYKPDMFVEPGDVVVFGGEFDITTSNVSHDHRIAGIVSSDPAYLMNAKNNDGSYIPVALTGRVPCKVKGPIKKGDLLVQSNTAGVATKLDNTNWKPGCVIGKSLENLEDTIKIIEVAVGRF